MSDHSDSLAKAWPPYRLTQIMDSNSLRLTTQICPTHDSSAVNYSLQLIGTQESSKLTHFDSWPIPADRAERFTVRQWRLQVNRAGHFGKLLSILHDDDSGKNTFWHAIFGTPYLVAHRYCQAAPSSVLGCDSNSFLPSTVSKRVKKKLSTHPCRIHRWSECEPEWALVCEIMSESANLLFWEAYFILFSDAKYHKPQVPEFKTCA